MDQVFLFAVLGLGSGALIAAIGTGVVLFYRGSGMINLGTAAIAISGAYAYYALKVNAGLSMTVALIVAIVFCALLGLVLELLVVRPLRNATPLAKLVASLGVMLLLQSIALLVFGSTTRQAPQVLPADSVTIFDVPIPIDRFILTGIVIVATIALAVVYRYTRFGLATRASAESQPSAVLAGLSPTSISLVNTVAASVLSGVFGILVAPLIPFDSGQMLLLVVPALAAALLAGFTSFSVACATGLGFGIMESLLTYVQSLSWFPTADNLQIAGVSDLIIFLVIVVTMFVRGSSLPQRGVLIEQRLPEAPRAQRLFRPTIVLAVAGAAALIWLPFDFRNALVLSLVGIVLALSLTVLTGFVGQVSLLQVPLAGIAAFAVSRFAMHAGIGFPAGAIMGVLIATGFGVLAALSALRVRGVSLAIVTLAAGVAVQNFGFGNSAWGAEATGSEVPDPKLFGLNFGPRGHFALGDGKLPSPMIGFLALAVTIVCALVVAQVRRSALGQRMLAVRSNETAAAAAGIDVRRVKLIAFALSAAIAGVGGVLTAYNLGSVTAEQFGVAATLALVAFVYVGGITTIFGAIIAGLITTNGLFAHAAETWFHIPSQYTLLVGAIVLVFNVVLNPQGIAGNIAASFHRPKKSGDGATGGKGGGLRLPGRRRPAEGEPAASAADATAGAPA